MKEDDGDRNSCVVVINMYNEFNFVNKQMIWGKDSKKVESKK